MKRIAISVLTSMTEKSPESHEEGRSWVMNKILNNDAPLRRYLLGEMALDEEPRVEERLLMDSDYIEQLEVVEEDLIDEYVRGNLPPPQQQNFEERFLNHPERRKKILLARALTERARSFNPTPEPKPNLLSLVWEWLTRSIPAPVLSAAATAIVFVALGFGIYQFIPRQSDEVASVNEGLDLLNKAFRHQRPFEARISGFEYVEQPIKKGGADDKLDSVSFRRADRVILDALGGRDSSTAQYAAAKLFLFKAANQLLRATKLSEEAKDPKPAIEQAKEDLDTSIGHFGEALKADPNNARIHSDLGVAFMERGKLDLPDPDSGQSLKYFGESAKELNQAIKNDNSLLEAWFNLALLRHTQQLWSQAEESWVEYLKKDPNSPWAKEARDKLEFARRKKEERKSMTKERLLRDFLSAYRRGDRDEAWRVLSQNREPITGKLIWWQLADEFLKYSTSNQTAQADEMLKALSFAGELEAAKGDQFVRNLLNYYRKLSKEQLASIENAHKLVSKGHLASLQSNYDEALGLYRLARDGFEKCGGIWEAMFADYWLGYSSLATRRIERIEESRLILEKLINDSSGNRCLWLQARAHSSLGGIRYENTDQGRGIEQTKQALSILTRIEDTHDLQRNLTQLAYLNSSLNDYNGAVITFQKCLQVARDHWPGSRQMWRTYVVLAPVLNSLNFYEAADDYLKEALSFIEEFHDPAQVYYSYSTLGDIYVKLGNKSEAIRVAILGYETAKRLSNTRAGLQMTAVASRKLGDLYREFDDFDKALSYYDDAVKWYQQLRNEARIYDAHKGRLLCYLAKGDNKAAEEEIKTTLSYAENYRPKISDEKLRNTFFDAEQKFYDLAIDFEYTRQKDYPAAYNYAEASRARSLLALLNSQVQSASGKGLAGPRPLSLQQIQRQMPPQVQILQFSLLEDKLIAWVISKDSFTPKEKVFPLSKLQEQVNKYREMITQNSLDKKKGAEALEEAKSLYRILISPVEPLLDVNKTICLILDKALNQFPFGALVSPDSGNYLIEDYLLMVAPSATIFVQCAEAANRLNAGRNETLLSVGNPAWDKKMFPTLPELNEAEREAKTIAGFYSSATVLTRENAEEAAVKSGMYKANVVHLSSHYVVDKQSPTLSKLLLAKGTSTTAGEDGMLVASEVYARRFTRTRLAVLSACQSGVEGYYNGEGMIGMSRTFIASGVPLVVASLWPVDERPTAKLMINFHQYRRVQKRSTAQALRLAQLELIKENAESGVADYNWASFVVIGGYSSF